MNDREQLIRRLRTAKQERRKELARLPLREKIKIVIQLQRAAIPIIRRRRALEPWEEPWQLAE